MSDLCAICGVAPRNPLANVCQSCSDEIEQKQARRLAAPCPACEAAARELADLRARIAALCDYYDNMTGAADEKPLVMGDLVDELRALLAEKEAK